MRIRPIFTLPPPRSSGARGGRTRRWARFRRLAMPVVALLLLAGSVIGAGSGPFGSRGEPDEAPEPGPIRREPGAPPWPDGFEIGLQAARAYTFHFGLVEDDSLLARMNRIGYEVTSQAGRPDILFTFHILDVPDPNAFALPGGFIFLTRGMTELDLSDAALANLLGHEAAHVAHNHFSRAGRINTALSLLQTAVVVAAILAVPSSSSGGYDQDAETGAWRSSLTGKDAAIQGTSIFGEVFRELLVRGYSRGLEYEADDHGRRFAQRAGYPSDGSVALLEGLHERVHEDREFGYWRTHPYFKERVARARAAGMAGGSSPDSAEVSSYRRSVSERLSALAASIRDEPTALFLARSALLAARTSESALEIERDLLARRTERLLRQRPVLRAYGPLLADYDTLLAAARRAGRNDLARAILPQRESLERERLDLHPDFVSILGRVDAGTPFLELFLANYPEDPEASEIRLRLAERYRLADRPDEAALTLAQLKDPDAFPRAEAELKRVLPLVHELTTSQRLSDEGPTDSTRTWARQRLDIQATGFDSLEVGSRFLNEFPRSPVAPVVAEKVEELAMARYRRGRLEEGLRELQAALDEYHRLILLAPGTHAARLAREGIDRIQATAGK